MDRETLSLVASPVWGGRVAEGVIRMDLGEDKRCKALSVPESDHPVAFCICN